MRRAAILMLFWASAAIAADMNSAFQDGKSLGSSVNQGAFSGINSGSAADKVPAYGTNPSETQFFQGGQGDLSGPGVSKMQNCATATPDSDPIKRQECEAVNFLARNPQIRPQFNITKNDPMILAAKHARNNAESFFQSLGIKGGAGSSTQCTTKTETTPAQYTTETCSSLKEVGEQQCTMGRVINIDADANFQCEQTVNAYETFKCRRGFSPNFGVQVDTNFYNPNYGSEVPQYSARTFSMVTTIDENVTSFKATLKYYQADNYGQLWINGNLVIQNVLPGFQDMRGAYTKMVTSCNEDGWCSSTNMIYGNGWSSSYYDDSCNWGCRGTSPNSDITSYFKKGQNIIEIACLNVVGIGPCAFQIEITTEKKIVTGSTIQNGCAQLEARAR